MKKWICFLGAVISCMLFTISAQADVLFEPEDSFYHAHSSECEYVERQYIANGPDGKVIVYESPESQKTVDTWENGQQETIYFTFEDGEGIIWGVGQDEGWVPMEYMEVVYDNVSFMEEHEAEIRSQEGRLDGWQEGDTVYFWKYPGSEVTYEASVEENPITYDNVYEDSEGRSWGYVVYYYGHRDLWICLDQPAADYGQIYPTGAPQKQQGGEKPTEENPERIQPKVNYAIMAWAIALVGIVVVVTIVLLVILKKKGKK